MAASLCSGTRLSAAIALSKSDQLERPAPFPSSRVREIEDSLNPSDVIKTSDLAPPPRAPVGPSDARDGLGLTAVAYSTTLSLSFFSVSPKISTGGLTNMAKSHYPPAFRQTRESRRK